MAPFGSSRRNRNRSSSSPTASISTPSALSNPVYRTVSGSNKYTTTINNKSLSVNINKTTYRLGTQDYISWHNGLSHGGAANNNLASGGFKSDDSVLIFGRGIQNNAVGITKTLGIAGNISDITQFKDLPNVGDVFLSKSGVARNRNLSELKCDVISRRGLVVYPTESYTHSSVMDHVYLSRTYIDAAAGDNQPDTYNTTYSVVKSYGNPQKRLVITIPKLYSADNNRDYASRGGWVYHNESFNFSASRNLKFEPVFLDWVANNNDVEITFPAIRFFSERVTPSDAWIETSSVIKITGSNNTISIRIPDNTTYSFAFNYRGNDAHRALVSVEGERNTIIFTVGVNSRIVVGHTNQYDNFGYWAASNSDTNLYIFQTADGRPLKEAIIWENIENPVSTINNYPNTILAKYEHQGEHNPFKHWIGNGYGG